MNKNYLKKLKIFLRKVENPKIFENFEMLKISFFFSKKIFCFVHNFFETKYFSLIFFK